MMRENNYFLTPEQYEAENRLRNRQMKLQEFLEQRELSQRQKIEESKKREENRKEQVKLLWERRRLQPSIERIRQTEDSKGSDEVGRRRKHQEVELMFEGKSCDQYYRDRYFHDVHHMDCPPEYMAEKQYPILVKPEFVEKGSIHAPIKKQPFKTAKMPKAKEPFRADADLIIEPKVMKYSMKSIGGMDGEDKTLNRYRYFNLDNKGVRFIVTKPKQDGTPKMSESVSLPKLHQNHNSSSSVKLPPLTKGKQGATIN